MKVDRQASKKGVKKIKRSNFCSLQREMIKDYRLEFRIQMRDSCFLEIMNFEVRLSLPNKHTIFKKSQ